MEKIYRDKNFVIDLMIFITLENFPLVILVENNVRRNDELFEKCPETERPAGNRADC